ncbi:MULTISPECIES: hypothetical protein [Natronospira]
MEAQIGLHYADFDDFDDGFGVSGSIESLDFLPQLRLGGEFSSVEYLDVLRFSAGWVLDMDELEIDLGYSYRYWDFEGDFDEDIYSLHAKVQYSVLPELHLRGSLEFAIFDHLDDETAIIGVGAAYDITPEFSLGLDVEVYEADFVDQTFIRFGASYHF